MLCQQFKPLMGPLSALNLLVNSALRDFKRNFTLSEPIRKSVGDSKWDEDKVAQLTVYVPSNRRLL